MEFPAEKAGQAMRQVGQIPLPPYIRRLPDAVDRRRYQTVFAKNEGAVAAPTAGLHFTRQLLSALKTKGVRTAFLTLHVNYATFAAVREENLQHHRMTEEYFHIPGATVELIRRTRKEGGRVCSVGTTVAKALEENAAPLLGKDDISHLCGRSSLFIYPPYTFKVVNMLITNFHLPRTTLLMLVSALAGCEAIKKAYGQAVEKKYRFYSYGDAMLII